MIMEKILRIVGAWFGAKKLTGKGCGCGTLVVFIILYWLLGYVFKLF